MQDSMLHDLCILYVTLHDLYHCIDKVLASRCCISLFVTMKVVVEDVE